MFRFGTEIRRSSLRCSPCCVTWIERYTEDLYSVRWLNGVELIQWFNGVDNYNRSCSSQRNVVSLHEASHPTTTGPEPLITVGSQLLVLPHLIRFMKHLSQPQLALNPWLPLAPSYSCSRISFASWSISTNHNWPWTPDYRWLPVTRAPASHSLHEASQPTTTGPEPLITVGSQLLVLPHLIRFMKHLNQPQLARNPWLPLAPSYSCSRISFASWRISTNHNWPWTADYRWLPVTRAPASHSLHEASQPTTTGPEPQITVGSQLLVLPHLIRFMKHLNQPQLALNPWLPLAPSYSCSRISFASWSISANHNWPWTPDYRWLPVTRAPASHSLHEASQPTTTGPEPQITVGSQLLVLPHLIRFMKHLNQPQLALNPWLPLAPSYSCSRISFASWSISTNHNWPGTPDYRWLPVTRAPASHSLHEASQPTTTGPEPLITVGSQLLVLPHLIRFMKHHNQPQLARNPWLPLAPSYSCSRISFASWSISTNHNWPGTPDYRWLPVTRAPAYRLCFIQRFSSSSISG